MTAKVTFEFPTDVIRAQFLGWVADGGGEYTFLEHVDPDADYQFDYSKAFPAWGYDPEVDGHPVVTMTEN